MSRKSIPNRKVYFVRHAKTRKRYVVKRYRKSSEAARERNVLRAFTDHTHLVKMHRYYRRKGMGYIVMERIKGPTIERLVKRRGRFNTEHIVALATEILTGLKTLHELGYVHGDFHGRNVIVTDRKAPAIKIIDFQHAVRKNQRGVARARRKLPKPPLELAPETRRRSIRDSYDIYGVGYICAMLAMGKVPKRRSQIARRLSKRSPLWRVIKKAMHRNHRKRYQSAQEMLDALQSL